MATILKVTIIQYSCNIESMSGFKQVEKKREQNRLHQ